MIRPTNIHSITEFQRHAKNYIQQVTQTKDPIAITVNGSAQVVVQDAATYQQMVDELKRVRFLEALREGERAVAEGKTIPEAEAFAEIRARNGL